MGVSMNDGGRPPMGTAAGRGLASWPRARGAVVAWVSVWVGLAMVVGGAGCSSDSGSGGVSLVQGDEVSPSPPLPPLPNGRADVAVDTVHDAVVDSLDVEPDSGADSASDIDLDTSPDGDTSGLEAGALCQEDAQCVSGHCLLSRQGRRCAASCEDTCEGDLVCTVVGGDRVCVDPYVSSCLPCDSHAECDLGAGAGLEGLPLAGGDRCVGQGEGLGRFCAVACGPERGCLAGSSCVDGLCRPDDGVCECTALAIALESETSCGCGRSRRCEVEGKVATACDGPGPRFEVCNGKDDDCDGAIDGDELCGAYACAGGAGCRTRCETNADCQPGLGCDRDDVDSDGVTDECLMNGDNGTNCATGADCTSGTCSNGHCCPAGVGQALCCAQDADCSALDRPGQCISAGGGECIGSSTVGRCEASVCVSRQAPAPELCAGSVCRAAQCTGSASGAPVFDGPHICDAEGACMPTADRLCDDGQVCTLDSCGATGCQTTPITSTTQTRCYSFDPATRGVGVCSDGFVRCDGGVTTGCLLEKGPSPELCNGRDDDCDGRSDEDTEPACFPYLCRGTAGCGTSCGGNADCAAGNFCSGGRCVGTGATGASCSDGSQCASGYCSQGVCCESGLCCVSDGQCGALAGGVCQVQDAAGCFGLAYSGRCLGDNRCEAIATISPAVCAGKPCAAARCDGAAVVPQSACSATGQCVVSGPAVSCAPYACRDGGCKTSCASNADCSAGSCIDGQCSGLPDGAACTANGQCAVGRCNNGFCCASGTCCGGDAACGGLTQAAVCAAPGMCGGTQVVGVCGADKSCRTETRAAPAGCLGVSCGAPRCLNLSGGGLILEGVERKTCNAQGACATVVKDCRDFDDTAYCTNNSDVYLTCRDCSPKRSTCIVFDNPCFCD